MNFETLSVKLNIFYTLNKKIDMLFMCGEKENL